MAISLRHFFPEHWTGLGDDYTIAQHVDDLISFIERYESKPVDLLGHSRGGHICFQVAILRPDLVRKLVLVEPGGDLDPTLDPALELGNSCSVSGWLSTSVDKVSHGDLAGAVKHFYEMVEGEGSWVLLPQAIKQQMCDNAATLTGQVHEKRKCFTRADAMAIRAPTLFIGGGGETARRRLNLIASYVSDSRVVHILEGGHWMFDKAPLEFCENVLKFLHS